VLTRLDLELEVRKLVQERAEKHRFRFGLSQEKNDFHGSAGSKYIFSSLLDHEIKYLAVR
jgi:hypothetical protein